ncbi:24350_t:CDS:2 [Cetraspora pellucida]|uniref:24350_t:CDS:1 n=1 Tax=Cetraspora pellucida TaxID=1433469 RepID=A0A9N8Z6D0_9GLOM|nr:24350_t:CDS:2 [Cetraspora pellucida]
MIGSHTLSTIICRDGRQLVYPLEVKFDIDNVLIAHINFHISV